MTTRVMVIDDTLEIRELLVELLTEEGYAVVAYAGGIPNLDDVDQVQPDLIILDHIIAGEAVGLPMLEQLQQRRSTAQISVIVCTAAAQAVEEMQGCLQARGVRVMLKPFAIDDVLDAVQQALEADRRGELPADVLRGLCVLGASRAGTGRRLKPRSRPSGDCYRLDSLWSSSSLPLHIKQHICQR